MLPPAQLHVLDASVPAERRAWEELWSRWPDREVQAHPVYGSLFARDGDRVLAATLDAGQGAVLYPFILRPLGAEEWADAGEERWDLTTAYGYGGPFAWNLDDAFATRFWDALERWLAARRVVSSFARLSLFEEEILVFRGKVESSMGNIVRGLDLDEEAMWHDYAHKVRKNVKRARQHGLEVEEDDSGRRLEEFLGIYSQTMRRRRASAGYHFSRDFFETIVSGLQGQFMFFHVLQHGEVVSSELVLVSRWNMYSFLGGTVESAMPLRANDLLKHAVIDWGRRQRKRAFVLGGGYGAEDGIFRYKRSFAPGGEVPFRVGTSVHDRDAYAQLLERRMAWEAARGRSWAPSAEYFPEYRS